MAVDKFTQMSNKLAITQALVKLLDIDQTLPKNSTNDLLFKWWATGRTGDSLRLTDEGFEAFTKAEIEFYDFTLFDKKTNLKKEEFKKFTLSLGKKIRCPWYINFKNQKPKSAYIRVYDSKVAMMIQLYGNFQDFLDLSK